MAPNTRRARFVHTNREKEEESSSDEPVEEEEEDEMDEEEEQDETTKVTARLSPEKEEKIAKEKKKEPITISLKKVCKDETETVAVIGRYISENYDGVALHPIDIIDTGTGSLLTVITDPDITTITPVNKLHPRADILASGSSRSVFVWKPKVESEEPQSEQLKRKQRKFIYGSATGKKSNSKGPYNDSSDDEGRFGKDGKNRKVAKKTETKFTHNATKGKGKSKM